MFRKILSWLWPMTHVRADGLFGPLEVRWENGRKVLNSEFGNQSFGSLHRVWQSTLAQLDLTTRPPRSVLILGLGGGSLLEILREELGMSAPITAVELDPTMVELARTHFGSTRHQDVSVLVGDAMIQVHALRERYDLVLVDLFDDLDLARGVDSRSFIHGLRDRCAENGVVCINTVSYNEDSEKRCGSVRTQAERAFHEVTELRLEDVNRVLILR
jgi:spermidine synthase